MGMPEDRFGCFKSKSIKEFFIKLDTRMCELEKAEKDLRALREAFGTAEKNDDKFCAYRYPSADKP